VSLFYRAGFVCCKFQNQFDGRSHCTSTMNLSMCASVATGYPPLPLAAEAGLAQEIDAVHARLEELQSFSVGSKDGKRCVSAQSKTDRKHKASRALFEYADQMKDSAAVLQHSLDALSNEMKTHLEKIPS
jgi:hypothetical protein